MVIINHQQQIAMVNKMGWTGIFANYVNIKEFADAELKPKSKSEYTLIDRSIFGNEVYLLLEHKLTKEKVINVVLVNRNAGEWLYKEMSESVGPYYYNCADRLLVQSTCRYPDAIIWRNKCTEMRLKKNRNLRAAKELKGGEILKYEGEELIYVRPYNKSYGQLVCTTVENGKPYRYKTTDLVFPNA